MQISEILNRFNKLKIFVIGDIVLDRYISGTVDRISPEAPVPALKVKEESESLGGTGNVAMILKVSEHPQRLLELLEIKK